MTDDSQVMRDCRVLKLGVAIVATAAVVSLPPVRRQLSRLLLWSTGTVVRNERPQPGRVTE